MPRYASWTCGWPWLLAACGTTPTDPAAAPAAASGATLLAAAPGTILQLRPVTAVGLQDDQARDLIAIDGWWRAAMRQSRAFDIAAAPDDGSDLPNDPWRLDLALDPPARSLVVTALAPGRPPVVLGTATFAGPDLPVAIDRLAAAVRAALGEDAIAAVPVASCVSADPLVAAGVERAADGLALGDPRQAIADLERARRRDGGSPAVLDLLASARALLGDAAAARSLATEALGMTARVSPPQQHRLLRTVLLARAVTEPDTAASCDAELARLGAVADRERPHDAQVRLTIALALNLRGEFGNARPLLAALQRRLPGNATVRYHLAFAQLATGEPDAARAGFAAIAGLLPLATTLAPRAIACFDAGAHDELRELLSTVAADPDVRAGGAWHEVQRMRAAHAILTGRADEAADLLLADVAWLLQRPSLLVGRAGEFADTGEVLVRLGRGDALRPSLAAAQSLAHDAALADAIAFVDGLCQVAGTGERAQAVEARLARGGESAWGAVLAAFAHRQRGELADEFTDLSRAANLSDGALIKASLVRCLRARGRAAEADNLRDALRREMHVVNLRQRLQHPLLAPERALASLVD
jgi:tetratricopeptide (TPR) repeat protein